VGSQATEEGFHFVSVVFSPTFDSGIKSPSCRVRILWVVGTALRVTKRFLRFEEKLHRGS
jgi:hypothetical protein